MKARLVQTIPADRLRVVSGDGKQQPKIGEFGETDQCYTGEDGLAMVMVYFLSSSDGSEWEAEAYESELEPVPAWTSGSTNSVFYYTPNDPH